MLQCPIMSMKCGSQSQRYKVDISGYCFWRTNATATGQT